MKIMTADGHTYSGTPSQIVTQLNVSSRAHALTSAAWMQEAADRATMTSGTDVRFDTALHFLYDLSKAGQIKILEDA